MLKSSYHNLPQRVENVSACAQLQPAGAGMLFSTNQHFQPTSVRAEGQAHTRVLNTDSGS